MTKTQKESSMIEWVIQYHSNHEELSNRQCLDVYTKLNTVFNENASDDLLNKYWGI